MPKQITKANPQDLSDFDLKQRCHIALERIHAAPGRRKWLLYVLPLLENTAAYKERVSRFGKSRAAPFN